MLAILNIPWVHKDKARTSWVGALYATLDILQAGNPQLAQAVHDSGERPPYSAHLHKGVLRLGILRDDVLAAVIRSPFAQRAELVATTTYEALLGSASTHNRLALRLLTPVSLGNNRDYAVLPDAKWIFASLLNRWRMFGGPPLPDLCYDSTAVREANVKVVKLGLGRYEARGCVGHVTYVLRSDLPDDARRAYHALARFAEYSGVGRKTSHGLGRVVYYPATQSTSPLVATPEPLTASPTPHLLAASISLAASAEGDNQR